MTTFVHLVMDLMLVAIGGGLGFVGGYLLARHAKLKVGVSLDTVTPPKA